MAGYPVILGRISGILEMGYLAGYPVFENGQISSIWLCLVLLDIWYPAKSLSGTSLRNIPALTWGTTFTQYEKPQISQKIHFMQKQHKYRCICIYVAIKCNQLMV